MYRLTLKIRYCKRPVRHTFCFAKVCLTALEKRALRSPFYPSESQTQNRVDFASQNDTSSNPKTCPFFAKKGHKKPHKKSRKFATRKSAFLKALRLLIFYSKLTQPLANFFQIFNLPKVTVVRHGISDVL